MAQTQRYYRNVTMWEATQSFLDLIYITTVRQYRSTTGGAIMSFFTALVQPLTIFVMFAVIYAVFGRTALIRGDFLLFMMTGIFAYLMHIRAVKSVGAGEMGGMIFYARASKLLSILSGAISELYSNILAMAVIFSIAYLWRGYLEIYDFSRFIGPMFMAWASGLAVGLFFVSITPFAPSLSPMLFLIYKRIQMFTSGKAFVANLLPHSLLPFFTWNPLFHAIDQARGAAFINYVPRYTNMTYPTYFTIAVFVLALIVLYAVRAAQDRGIE